MSRRLLADGRPSRGFIAVECELPESVLSNEALGLLLRLRHIADRDESDGWIDDRAVSALAAFHGLRRDRIRRLIDELVSAGLLILEGKSIFDANFNLYNRTRAEREKAREGWRERKDRQLHNPLVSRRESQLESRSDSTRESHDDPVLSLPVLTAPHLPAGEREDADFVQLASGLETLFGRVLSGADLQEARAWVTDFAYLSAQQMLDRVGGYFEYRGAQGLGPPRTVRSCRGSMRHEDGFKADRNGRKADRQGVARIGDPPRTSVTATPSKEPER